MTTRGRVLVVAVFVLSAAICASAAVALVVASDEDRQPLATLPSVHPTVVFPTDQPTSAAPTPSRAPTTAATASSSPAATPSPTLSATPSPAVRPSSGAPSPTPVRTPLPPGLFANASVAEASGASAGDPVHVKAHATDGDGSISLLSLDWGDGSSQVRGGRGTVCSPPAAAPADCRNFAWTHPYAAPGSYTITIWLVSGLERSRLLLPLTIG
jgi:hypothetical protein